MNFLTRPQRRRAYVVACGRMLLTRVGAWKPEPDLSEVATFGEEGEAIEAARKVLGLLIDTDGLGVEVLPAEIGLLVHFATEPAGWVQK